MTRLLGQIPPLSWLRRKQLGSPAPPPYSGNMSFTKHQVFGTEEKRGYQGNPIETENMKPGVFPSFFVPPRRNDRKNGGVVGLFFLFFFFFCVVRFYVLEILLWSSWSSTPFTSDMVCRRQGDGAGGGGGELPLFVLPTLWLPPRQVLPLSLPLRPLPRPCGCW